MFWKGTLLAEPREKPAHSHHPLLYTSPLTDTNLYSSTLPVTSSRPLFFPQSLPFLLLFFHSCILPFYFIISPPHPALRSRPLISRPSAALSILFNPSALIAFLMHGRRGHCGEVQREVARESIPPERGFACTYGFSSAGYRCTYFFFFLARFEPT